MTLIKNGLIDSSPADILIKDGKIAEIGINLQANAEVIDAKGLTLLPAFTDLHCHLRTPGQQHKETVDTGTAAAVAGGYTTLVAMANTAPVCSTLDIARQVEAEARNLERCDVFQCLSLTKDFDGKDLSHLEALKTGDLLCISEDGRGVANGHVLLEALRLCKERNLRVLIHAEDSAFSDMADAENYETIRDLHIAGNLPLHFCHVSTAVAVNAIVSAKQRGAPVTFEVSPHHIALNDTTRFRVNPPLRPEHDRQAVLKAIQNGHVDAIATDHAPHTAEDKQNGAPGLIGLETAFAVCYTTLVKGGLITLSELTKLMSEKPAKMLGINKGKLSTGYDADIALIDLNAKFTVDSGTFRSKARNTPFNGMELYGKIAATLKSGKIVYKQEELL